MSVHPIKAILTSEPWKKQGLPIPILSHQTTYSPSNPSITKNLSPQHIQWLWIQLIAIYGQLFISKNGESDSNGVWFAALCDLTPKALESGIKRINQLPADGKFITYPPNCLEFKGLCLAFYQNLGLPSADEAYREIKDSMFYSTPRWSHKVVKLMAMRLPQNFLLIEPEHIAKSLFRTVYDQVCHLVKQGHEIPEIPEQVRLQARPHSKSVALYHLKKIKELLRT